MNKYGELKCPHCGWTYPFRSGLVPTHDWPKPCRQVCPGKGQTPRGMADRRLLWKDEMKGGD